MNFKEVYKPPFKSDGYCCIFTDDNNMAFTILTEDKILLERVLAKLNGESEEKFEGVGYSDRGHILVDKKIILLVRGWGHLIGIGGLHLPINEAKIIQDDFIKWVVKTLKY